MVDELLQLPDEETMDAVVARSGGTVEIKMNFPDYSYTITLSETIAPDEVVEMQILSEMVSFMVTGYHRRRDVSYGVRDALLAGTRRRA